MSFRKQAETIVQTLSLKEKVGQLFMLAYPGKDPEEVKSIIEKYHIGGFYVTQDNAETFEEMQQLSKTLQGYSNSGSTQIPLLVASDQEGAWGVLVPESITGPGNLALGATGDESLAEGMYRIFGEEMQSAGFNTLLSPCSDINLSPDTPIIGPRSFGEDPEQVGKFVAAAVRGAKKTGVVTTAKHFPGHGDTVGDTHREIPHIDKSLEVLLENELKPFQAAIDAGVDMVMTAHILFPQVDSQFPATFSKTILQDVLRDRLGFEGIILTDSMNMGAVRKNFTPAESAVMALKAGVEMIMVCEEHYEHSNDYLEKQISMLEGVIEAIQKGDVSEDHVDQVLTKVIAFKLEKFGNKEPSTVLTVEEKEAMANKAAQQALTVVSNKANKWPLKANQPLVCVNATPRKAYQRLMNPRGIGPNQATPAFDSFEMELRQLRNDVTFLAHESVETTEKPLSVAKTIVVVTEDYPLPGEDFQKDEQIQMVQNLLEQYGDKVVVLGLRSAYEVKDFLNASTYVSSFSSRTCSAKAAAQALAGQVEALGQSPVSLPTA